MRRTIFAATTLVAACAAAGPANAATVCTADHPGCFAKALAAAHTGDVIRLGPGTFRGGVKIGAGIEVRGAGAGTTSIVGGGPVIEIAPEAGTVTIRGVTIAGAVTTAFITPQGQRQPQFARGGGLLIRSGATVTVTDSVIEDNATAPSDTVSSGSAMCGDGPCRFAGGYGAGIYSEGTLTLTRTLVARNRNRSPAASDAEGGGIYTTGPLTLIDSQVIDNEALATPPYGRFATAGGIFVESGHLIVRRSAIARNRATLHAAWPDRVTDKGAVGGGVLVGDQASALIEQSRIVDNDVRFTNTAGDAIAFSGGVHGNGPVDLIGSIVASNHVTATVAPNSPSTASADSGAGNLNVAGTISGSRLVDNTVTAVGGSGPASARAGGLWTWTDEPIVMRDSLVSGNSVRAAAAGEVTAQGAGLLNTETLELHGTTVALNRAHASGRSGLVQGGGIWNGRAPESQDFLPRLTIFDSLLLGNLLSASGGEIDVHGGGLFAAEPATVSRTRIAANLPDQCVGCGVAEAPPSPDQIDAARAAAHLAADHRRSERSRGPR